MIIRCIKTVSVTGKRCAYPVIMLPDRMIYMCENHSYAHFFSHKELMEAEEK